MLEEVHACPASRRFSPDFIFHNLLPFSKVKAFATDGELDTDHKDVLDSKDIEVFKPISIDQESHRPYRRAAHLS